MLWAFPLYWGLVTTFKHEYEIVTPGFHLWPEHFTFENYVHVLLQTKIGYWYINSLITSAAVTVIVVMMAAGAGYAISQLNFPGRRFFWWMILASFMVPIPALIVTHFIVISQLRPHQHPGRGGRPAAHRAGDRHHLQAVLRLGAEGFPRGGRHRRRERISAPVPNLSADELG